MAELNDILKALPIDQIASQLGVDPDVARRAVEEGGATILSGLQSNAQTADGASALEKALAKHTGATGGPLDLSAVDTADGEKILGHIFGGQEQQVAQKLTDAPQTAGIDFGKLLPVLAPIVLGVIANMQKGNATAPAAPAGADPSAGGIGDLIGGLIGGLAGSGTSGSSAGGIDIGGLLGGLLGGQK